MKRSDLFREYARCIDMCEGTSAAVEDGIKYRGKLMSEIGDEELSLFVHHPEHYEFALAILEGKPVFKGDEVYLKDGRKYDWNGVWGQIVHHLTWTKPRTFTLNGEMLPCPQTQGDYELQINRSYFYFDSVLDRNDVVTALEKLLTNAKNS